MFKNWKRYSEHTFQNFAKRFLQKKVEYGNEQFLTVSATISILYSLFSCFQTASFSEIQKIEKLGFCRADFNKRVSIF